MATYYRVKGWEKYQHYKDRAPPWIKLHGKTLTSETWVSLDDASRVLAIACMLIAAATDNRIPSDPAYIKRVAYLNGDPDFAPLLRTQFIELVDEGGKVLADASATLANRTECSSEERRVDQRRGDQSAPRSSSEKPPAPVRKRKAATTSIPNDFGISDRVRAWATERKFTDLERHLEAFLTKVAAKGYQYVDWDSAFMNAIREDWAKLKMPRTADGPIPFQRNSPSTNPLRDTSKDYSSVKTSTPETAHAVVSAARSKLTGGGA